MKYRLAIIKSEFMTYYLEYFLEKCKEHNIKVDLFIFDSCSKFEEYAENVYFLKSCHNPKNYKSKSDIEKEIKSLVNINDYDYFLTDCLGLSFCCNVFHNVTLHTRIKKDDNYIYGKILELFYSKRLKAESIYYKDTPKNIVVSNILKEDYSVNCNINPKNILVVYPGVNAESENPTKRIEDNIFVFGSVNCGFTTKGGYNILRALRIFNKKFPGKNVKIKMINPKYRKFSFIYFYLKLFKLDKTVEILSYYNDINEFYREIDCLICASEFEAFGRIVTEAMINNVPVITGTNVGASDIIKDRVNGFIYKYDKKRYYNLAVKMNEIIENKENLEKIKQNAFNTAQNLTWENFAKNIFSFLYF